jgi:hypothetical protein
MVILIGAPLINSPQLGHGVAVAKPIEKHLVEPYIAAMWDKVAWCETHGQWHRDQPIFDGGLGISRHNWVYYGGRDFAEWPHLASREEQIVIARRIQSEAGVPNYIPDQAGGCHAW